MARIELHKSLVALSLGLALVAQVHAQGTLSGQSEALARLSADTGQSAQVSVFPATGAARFVRVAPGGKLLAAKSVGRAATDATRQADALRFLSSYGGLFGLGDAKSELGAARFTTDQQGRARIAYPQVYQGVPVFAGGLRAHFDAASNLVAVSGTFIPGIDVAPTPTRSAAEAVRAATARVLADLGRPARLRAAAPVLMVFRDGLAKGVPGANHLAWQVEVGNRVDVREFVYVDAHTGKVIEKFTGIHDDKNRRAFDGAGATAPGPNYPGSPFWVEGAPFPTGTVEADNMISASSEIYDLFKKAFGRDSYDGAGATMDSIFNRGNGCPNASWNGVFISFCPGTTTDDVTAHEWGHAYTEYTDNLIYAWQPGALNESYSDIWGETLDRLNGRGGDTPDAARSAGACTIATPQPPTLNITAPAAIAGVKGAGTASFGPTTFSLSGEVVLANDGSASPSLGCTTPFANAAVVAGKIAFMDRGTCAFAVKAKNAQLNGAIGVIIGNNAAGAAPGMSGTDATIVIPTLSVSQGDGTAMKGQFGVNAVLGTMARGGNGTDSSVRWLIGEDSSAFGGAIRDMWNPTCYGNAGKVSDAQYTCATTDGGGVHSNSGVPNHGYALLVDGGSYNGQSIGAIGLTKAAHVYFRAQSQYQGPASDFAAHADALEQSCADLTGIDLNSLSTGLPSGEVISASDCQQVAKMALAVELRTPPSQCNFQPMLAKSPPPLCAAGSATSLAADGFDGGKRAGLRWTVSQAGVAPEFRARNWGVVNKLPGGRAGYGMFSANPDLGSCAPGGDQSGTTSLLSPEITIPADVTAPRLTFDHWVATEAGFDGGNLKISVDGGAWLVVPAASFVYNAYNTTLTSAAGGNTNPMAGQPAFSGGDGGSVTGSWGRSIVDLSAFATANAKIRLRFDLGRDGCGGSFGWYIDDVMVYRCTAP